MAKQKTLIKKQYTTVKIEHQIVAELKQRITDLGGTLEGWQAFINSQNCSIGLQLLGTVWKSRANSTWHFLALKNYEQYLLAQNSRGNEKKDRTVSRKRAS